MPPIWATPEVQALAKAFTDMSNDAGDSGHRRLYNRRPSNTSLLAKYSRTNPEVICSQRIAQKSNPLPSKSVLSLDAKEFVPTISLQLSPVRSRDVHEAYFPPLIARQKAGLLLTSFGFVQSSSPPPSPSPLYTKKRFSKGETFGSCVYCLKTGQPKESCETHCLRNPITKQLICPLLLDNLCVKCGDCGANVHITSECPAKE